MAINAEKYAYERSENERRGEVSKKILHALKDLPELVFCGKKRLFAIGNKVT
jgi:hypothetical protein